MNDRKEWIILLAVCMGSRLWSAIYYIEDPDSLRFALGVIDFDVVRIQPHFPAYPVFCFFAKLLICCAEPDGLFLRRFDDISSLTLIRI